VSEETQEPLEEADIVFDCPHCGKSLEIDARGAGMVIVCPDCNNNVQVPVPEQSEVESVTVSQPAVSLEAAMAQIQSLTATVTASQAKIERLVESLEEVRDRRAYLEKLRIENIARFDRIAGEMTVIQSALDRITTILQDAKAEKE
jgi:transcription elongation factor Elf1